MLTAILPSPKCYMFSRKKKIYEYLLLDCNILLLLSPYFLQNTEFNYEVETSILHGRD